jgi:hypothetical protein
MNLKNFPGQPNPRPLPRDAKRRARNLRPLRCPIAKIAPQLLNLGYVLEMNIVKFERIESMVNLKEPGLNLRRRY